MTTKKEKLLIKAKNYAISKNGECLSTEYIKCSDYLIWKCSNPYHDSWKATYNNIIHNNRWCPECSGKSNQNKKLIKAQEFAKSKLGECLSSEYLGAYQKMYWKCKNSEHPIWQATYHNVVNHNKWCLYCGIEKNQVNQTLKNGLFLAQELAKLKEGLCLSTEYINNHTKMSWKCKNSEHAIWESSYNNIKNGKWCPLCAKNTFYKENKIRKIFNYIFNAEFKNSFLPWNINPITGKKLELDGYNESLSLAFEFQGIQHYDIKSFKQDLNKLNNLQYRDFIKKDNCLKNNVTLIVIDDFDNISNKELVDLVINYIVKSGKTITKNIDYEFLNLELNKMTSFQELGLIKAKEYAKLRDGFCLSKEYIDRKTPLEWKCNNPNHKSWFRNMDLVYNNSWCFRCARMKLKSSKK